MKETEQVGEMRLQRSRFVNKLRIPVWLMRQRAQNTLEEAVVTIVPGGYRVVQTFQGDVLSFRAGPWPHDRLLKKLLIKRKLKQKYVLTSTDLRDEKIEMQEL